ncbi:MAG: Rieske 2Fe-2S domain-containing protein [Verrucomicrobiota bacterium]
MSLKHELSRRQFIRGLVLGAACSHFANETFVTPIVAAIQPLTTPGNGCLRFKVSAFPALNSEGGSVLFSVNPYSPVGPLGAFYPIIVNRGTGNVFHALRAACTHQGGVVKPQGGTWVCQFHGSVFDIDGDRVSGLAPVGSRLTAYNVTYDGVDNVMVEIPGLDYAMTPTSVPANGRMKLDFPTDSQVTYEVLFQQALGTTWAPVQFATTESGPANQTTLTGDGATATVYVERSTATGFYLANARVTAE